MEDEKLLGAEEMVRALGGCKDGIKYLRNGPQDPRQAYEQALSDWLIGSTLWFLFRGVPPSS